MPTYEYQCDACEHNFDEFQSFSDEPLKKCPKCKKSKLRRVFGAGAAIIFKGSGFYQTDYRSESYKAGAKAEEKATSANSSADTPAADTTAATPAASTESAPAAKKASSAKGKSSKSEK